MVGVASLSRMLDSALFDYDVVLSDRPSFKFGNGLTLRATSRVDIDTEALQKLRVYVLDGTAENTPMLIGAGDLDHRLARISYKGLRLNRDDDEGRHWKNDLDKLTSRHLAINVALKPTEIKENIVMYSPTSRGGGSDPPEGEGSEEEEDDRHDGPGGGGGDLRRKRRHTEETRPRPAQGAGRATAHQHGEGLRYGSLAELAEAMDKVNESKNELSAASEVLKEEEKEDSNQRGDQDEDMSPITN